MGQVWRGCQAGLPIAIGYIPIAMAFGLLAKSAGLSLWIAAMMSFFIYAGASQFVGVNLLQLGVMYGEIILTTFILNLRHFLMTASLAERMEPIPWYWRVLLPYGVTDETFTVASLQKQEKLSRWFLLGLNVTAFLAWNVGTWLGFGLAQGLPPALQASMGIALYAMFIGLLVPAMRGSRTVLFVASISMGLHALIRLLPLTKGLTIVLATLMGSLIGAIFFSEEEV
jgi:4-azaleucine resistance transporter AzlC